MISKFFCSGGKAHRTSRRVEFEDSDDSDTFVGSVNQPLGSLRKSSRSSNIMKPRIVFSSDDDSSGVQDSSGKILIGRRGYINDPYNNLWLLEKFWTIPLQII